MPLTTSPKSMKVDLATVKIVAIYALFGALWIYLSDTVVGLVVSDPVLMKNIAIFKGLLFIALTSSLLYFLIDRDVTRRRYIENQLQELTQRLNYHIDNTPLAVIELGPDMRIIRWTGAAEHIFGWKDVEVLGKRINDFRWIHEDDEKQVDEVSAELQTGKNRRRFSANRNYHKDGSIVYCEWYNSSLLDEAGNVQSILSLVLDVTERKKLEDSLQLYSEMLESRVNERTAELREKDRLLIQQSRQAAMGEMINNIAHQWRQPLNILGLNIQMLTVQYESGDFSKEFLDESTTDAMKLIGYMSQTIDDFRNFFVPDKEKTVFCVNQAIQQTVSLIDDSFKHDNIELVTYIDGTTCINGYPNEFSQVLLNILQNARDALLERNVAQRTVTIASSVENDRAVVTITDSAGGIPEDVIDKVFEPYFSTKGSRGTGIGLYMSKSIIETNMGGRITARNVPGGAEFKIEV